MGQHGRAPGVAQTAERQRRVQADAVALPGNLLFSFAIGKIRSEEQFERNAFGVGVHAAFQRGEVAISPRRRFGVGQLAGQPGAVGLQFQSGVEHEHLPAACEERFAYRRPLPRRNR